MNRKVIGLLLNNFVESYNQQESIERRLIQNKTTRIFKAWSDIAQTKKKDRLKPRKTKAKKNVVRSKIDTGLRKNKSGRTTAKKKLGTSKVPLTHS